MSTTTTTTTTTTTSAGSTTTETVTVTTSPDEGLPPAATAAPVPDSPGDPVDVKGKVAIVTGASRGIGAASALHLGTNGLKVVLAARSVSALEEVKAAIEAAGGEASCVKCDVTVASEVAATFQHAKDTYGGVDFVYANAGYEGDTSVDITEIEDDEMFNVVNINTMGYLYTLKYAVKAFRERGGGAIAFTSSIASIIPRHMAMTGGVIRNFITYGVTKASNDYIARLGCSFTESDNIRSYGILPACFETVMLQNIAKHQGSDTTDVMTGFNPFNPTETGDPKHIGKVLLAMFDNTTKYCSGETVMCDGDRTAKAEVFYKQLHNVHHEGGVGAWQYEDAPDVHRDYKGDPVQ